MTGASPVKKPDKDAISARKVGKSAAKLQRDAAQASAFA
jgi:hypothetical protein